jgi:hypothetical protein
VVPAHVRPQAARPQLGQPRRAGAVRGDPAVLAGPGGRRLPGRRRARHGQGRRTAGLGRRTDRHGHGRQRARADLGRRRPGPHVRPGGRARDLPLLEPPAGDLPGGQGDGRGGVRGAGRARGPLRAPGRDAAGVQLPLPAVPLGRRGAAARHLGVPRGRRGRRCAHHLGAVQPRRRPARLAPGARGHRSVAERDRCRRPAARRGPRPAAGPCGGPAHAGPAGLRVPLPGRGARPPGAHHPARRAAPGPDLGPVRGRGAGPRRVPGAPSVGARPARVRLRADRAHLAAPAGGVGGARGRGPARRPAVDAEPVPHGPAVARRARSWSTSATSRSPCRRTTGCSCAATTPPRVRSRGSRRSSRGTARCGCGAQTPGRLAPDPGRPAERTRSDESVRRVGSALA